MVLLSPEPFSPSRASLQNWGDSRRRPPDPLSRAPHHGHPGGRNAATIRRLYCAAGVHRRPPSLFVQACELSGRIGAVLQISAAPCARGGLWLQFVRPLPVGLNCTVPSFREGRRGVDGLPPHQRLVLQESNTCNFYMRFQRTALVQECDT